MGNIINIDFHGDPLTAVETEDHRVLVALRPLVVGMGLDWSAQYRRVKRDPILGPAVCMTHTTPVAMTATTPAPMAVCLPLDLIPGFLFRIDASRVDEAVRAKVLDYQRECFRVLADACVRPGERHRPAEPVLMPADVITPPEARKLVTEARMSFGERAARELWFKTGLPTVPAMYAPARQQELFTWQREG